MFGGVSDYKASAFQTRDSEARNAVGDVVMIRTAPSLTDDSSTRQKGPTTAARLGDGDNEADLGFEDLSGRF